jgi:hypothetical protein
MNDHDSIQVFRSAATSTITVDGQGRITQSASGSGAVLGRTIYPAEFPTAGSGLTLTTDRVLTLVEPPPAPPAHYRQPTVADALLWSTCFGLSFLLARNWKRARRLRLGLGVLLRQRARIRTLQREARELAGELARKGPTR